MTENLEKSIKKRESKETSKRKAMLRWGLGGHENEWVIHLEDFDINNYIPDYGRGNPRDLCYKLNAILGKGFDASNRGSRIEIFTPDRQPNYNKVVSALRQVLEDDWEDMDWYIEVEDEEIINAQHKKTEAFVVEKQRETRARLDERLKQIRENRDKDN